MKRRLDVLAALFKVFIYISLDVIQVVLRISIVLVSRRFDVLEISLNPRVVVGQLYHLLPGIQFWVCVNVEFQSSNNSGHTDQKVAPSVD